MTVDQQEAGVGIPDVALRGTSRNRRWLTALQIAIVISALFGFGFQFYLRAAPEYLDRHGCDVAQIARSISAGEGFSTRFIRPFNVSFVPFGEQRFPELNMAPVYPYALASVYSMFGVSVNNASRASLLCFGLLLVATVLLGSLLYSTRAGLLGAIVLGLSLPALRSAVSGHEWTMAGLWFTLLLCAIAIYHRASLAGSRACIWCAALAALPFSLLYGTHYAAIVILIPTAVYFAITGPSRRVSCIVFVVLSVVLVSPLFYLNYAHTMSPFLGAGAWDMMANTTAYPGDSLYRSVSKELASPSVLLYFPVNHFQSFAGKLVQGVADLLPAALAMLGLLGLPFAAVSALYRFRWPQANAVRGLCYAYAAVLLPVLALLGAPGESAILFCPVIAVTGAAYLFLLLDAKRLHRVFLRLLLFGLGLVTAVPALSVMFCPATPDVQDEMKSHLPYVLAQISTNLPLYSDQPWAIAFRTECQGIWLPAKDSDMSALVEAGFPLRVIVLSTECDSYSENDFWRVLHTIPWWRTYTDDPKTAVAEYLKAAQTPAVQTEAALKFFRQERRFFSISAEKLADFHMVATDPLRPNDIQVLERRN